MWHCYEVSNWKDKLTSYNGQSITYDAIGNPLSYRGMTMSWTGRRLNSVINNGTTSSYLYDANGIRTRKTVGSTMTEYFTSGSTILAEKTGSNVIWYIYDSDGEVLGFTYNGTPYYYLKNQQGDVYKVVNASGSVVASYTYDAWGKVTAASGSMANVNPIRYRSYYYDTETGLYYVSSRYYDPETCRFINTDDESLVTATPMALTDKNLFAYCDNNPVMREDKEGTIWNIIVGAIGGALIGGGVQIVCNLISGNNWSDGLGTAVLTGAASGALAATGVGLLGSIAGNAAISMAGNATNQVIKNRGVTNFDVGDMLVDGVIGGFAGAVGGRGMGKSANIKTLNKNLTKKIFSGSSKVARKGIKYYVSQTKFAYKNLLFKPLRNAGFASLIGYGSKAVYSR